MPDTIETTRDTWNARHPRVQFRAGGLLPHLRERAGPGQPLSEVAKRDLGRFYDLLGAMVLPPLDPELARVILPAIVNIGDHLPPRQIMALVRDFLYRYGQSSADARHLWQSLPHYDAAGDTALVDALERAALLPEAEGLDTEARLRRVGLLR